MPPPPDTPSKAGVVTVELLGQRYIIRSSLDPEQIGRLVAYVRGKLRSVSNRSPQRDLVRIAVLAALNIADDYFRCRDRRAGDDLTVVNRAMEIEALVDRAIEGASAPDSGALPDESSPDESSPVESSPDE